MTVNNGVSRPHNLVQWIISYISTTSIAILIQSNLVSLTVTFAKNNVGLKNMSDFLKTFISASQYIMYFQPSCI